MMIRLIMKLSSTDVTSVTRVGVFFESKYTVANFRAVSTLPSSLGVGLTPSSASVSTVAYAISGSSPPLSHQDAFH